MNPARLRKRRSEFPGRSRIVPLLAATLALMLTMSLSYGCSRENNDLAKLREENKALRNKIASLEKPQIPPKPQVSPKPEMGEQLLALARKLKASPSDFVGQQIALHCRFGGFEDKFLNAKNGPKFFPSYYIGFIVQSGKEIDEPVFDRLFISKKEAKKQGVYHLGVNDFITVYGMVNSAYDKEPWIEVYVAKKGWE